MKWGTKYGADYVNRLYGMVRRHLRGEFRFVCLTDRSDGMRTEVQCLPIPDLALPDGIPERGWKKLTTFAADLHGLKGTALFLDLDVVIVDDITPFFEQPGDFLIIHDWKRPWRITGNSSVYRFELGAHPEVLGAVSQSNTQTSARACATSRPGCRKCCTSKASSATGRPIGVRAGSTTACRASRSTTSKRPRCRAARASWSFTASSIRPTRSPAAAWATGGARWPRRGSKNTGKPEADQLDSPSRLRMADSTRARA